MTTSAFLVDTKELGRTPGNMQTIEKTVTLTEKLGTEVIFVPTGSDVELDLRLESVMDGVLVTGTARAHAEGECVRCLSPVDEDVEVEFTELFSYPEAVVDEDEDGEPTPTVEDDAIDLGATLTDEFVLQLPLNPVCREDCEGLCPDCGIELAKAEPGHSHEDPIDPRWAALTQLVEESKE